MSRLRQARDGCLTGELLCARRLTVPSIESCIRLRRVPGSDLGLPVCDGAWRVPAPCVGGAGAASHAVSEAGRPTSQGRTPEDAIVSLEGLRSCFLVHWIVVARNWDGCVCEDVMVEVEEGAVLTLGAT